MTPEDKVEAFLLADIVFGAVLFFAALMFRMWIVMVVGLGLTFACIEFYAAWNQLVAPRKLNRRPRA